MLVWAIFSEKRAYDRNLRVVKLFGKTSKVLMDIIKIILIALGLIAVVVIGFFLFGIITAILWYALWIGIIGALGYGAYKLFLAKGKETPKLEDKTPVAIADMENFDRTLEEYKRKSLPK